MSTIKRLTLYPAPADRDEFHHRYEEELWPRAIALPGCVKCRVTIPIEERERAYHVIGELYFTNAEALKAALASPQGQSFLELENAISTGGSPNHDLCVEHEATA